MGFVDKGYDCNENRDLMWVDCELWFNGNPLDYS